MIFFCKSDEKNWTKFLLKRDSGKLVLIDQEMFNPDEGSYKVLGAIMASRNGEKNFAEGLIWI
ncbi:MAG: hypothetical protein A2381_07360 [Bdellovibrionales bacterium RIFOXYB1_FULL_37_110]|nr:MAG: hypothetical protein A2181_04125 [Bdellovibrionales bacterium RIFOXYA1_FULL_38_20]OFZ52428.1 MAG: hypothetical protein A2417_00080 [Bdellovibrionales bacterium RIFOXYC1_FULL_37_79]OFZ59630.1 MAG: hypothetical protein A2381_07360 [Bdellovibrionales bacterium RIFOXYB1_FULL_37_110]OFZ62557.1 MAG: hypothetical protein A2577_11680 [Bdellovibrionales bacterium RIFOXYD1_FULL_36_51]